jgi:hypothetical protein
VRVYNPRKDTVLLSDAIKLLYLLKQSIDYQSGTVDSRMDMVDNIRRKVQAAMDMMDGGEA